MFLHDLHGALSCGFLFASKSSGPVHYGHQRIRCRIIPWSFSPYTGDRRLDCVCQIVQSDSIPLQRFSLPIRLLSFSDLPLTLLSSFSNSVPFQNAWIRDMLISWTSGAFHYFQSEYTLHKAKPSFLMKIWSRSSPLLYFCLYGVISRIHVASNFWCQVSITSVLPRARTETVLRYLLFLFLNTYNRRRGVHPCTISKNKSAQHADP